MTFGRPAMIARSFDVPVPVMVDDDYLGTHEENVQPAGIPSRLGMFVSSCTLLELLGDVLKFLSVGDLEPLSMSSWRRRINGTQQYLLSVEDGTWVSPFMVVDSFPELMDLFARWAPAMQAASIIEAISDLTQYGMGDGLVERVAARTVYGTTELYKQMLADKSRDDAIRKERRAHRP